MASQSETDNGVHKTLFFIVKGLITPVPPHNGHLSTMATFLCPKGGCCGEPGL